MKFIILLSAVLGLALGRSNLPFYVTEDDYADVDAIIADLTALRAFVDCFLDKGPCTSLGESVKVILQDSVVHACDRCNVPQKEAYGRILQGLKAKLPEEYQNFRQKYDPENKYFDALEAELSKFWNYKTRSQRPTA